MTLALRRLLFVLLVCACFACRARVSTEPDAPKAPTPQTSAASDEDRVPVGPEDASRGAATAYVTLVVFSDFRCPYCNRLSSVVDRLRDAYGGDVLRIVFKHVPAANVAQAKLASTVAQGVFALKGPDAFWKYRDLAVHETQPAGQDVIRKWAIQAGLTPGDIDAGLEKGAWADKVERDMALAKRLGVNEPPVSFVNGVVVSGAAPFEVLKDVVDVELAKAKTLEESGVPRNRIYQQAVAANAAQLNALHERNELDDPKAIWRVPVGTSPQRGKLTALVTIVEFSEFDCPTCKRQAQALERIRGAFADRVRLVWKDAPTASHARASSVAYFARAARAQKGDAGFWDMHDRIFAASGIDDNDLEMIARMAGLDAKAAMAAMKNQTAKKDLEVDRELGEDVEVSATPQIFVNGRRLIGEQPYERLAAVVEEEVKKAESLLRSGIEPLALYDWFIKEGRPQEPRRANVPVPSNAPYRGAVEGPLVIQAFAEAPCPACRRAEPIVEEAMKAFPGQVKLVWRDLPTAARAAESPLAAEAAREAYAQKGNEGFWKMQARFGVSVTALTRDELEVCAKDVGLDLDRFRKALDNHTHKPTIDSEIKAANDFQITITPTYVVGQYVIGGVPGLARFLRYAARALAEAPKPTAAAGYQVPPLGSVKFSVVDLVVGKGPPAQVGDSLLLHYRARLYNGPEFDSTYRRGPQVVGIGSGNNIAGWDRGLVGMRVGGRRRITIPPELGFGNHGVGKSIPANAVIVFDMELLRLN
jgi:protein-disulfide isomerase